MLTDLLSPIHRLLGALPIQTGLEVHQIHYEININRLSPIRIDTGLLMQG